MKTCDKCLVTIKTNQKYCPLCHQELEGEDDPHLQELYPEFVSPRRELLPLTKKIIMFLSVISILTLVLFNMVFPDPPLWSLIPIGSILYFWFVVRYGVLSKQNIAFKLAFLTTIMVIILNLIDQYYGESTGWALNYVTPFALSACNLAISVIIWIRRMNYRDYLFYLITIIVFSLVPLLLAFVGIIDVFWPALSTFGLAIFILLFIFFFFPKSIKEEFRKRFHL